MHMYLFGSTTPNRPLARLNAPSTIHLVGCPVKEMSLAVEWLPEEWPDYYSESEATASGNAPYNLHTTLLGRP